jgi:hypothetical protein
MEKLIVRILFYLVITFLIVPSLAAQQLNLVSINGAGTASGNAESFVGYSTLSSDGRYVAFTSTASDIVPNDTNGAWDLFVRDLSTGTTTLVSVNAAGTNSGNGNSGVSGINGPSFLLPSFAISGNGRWIAFSSFATDLAPKDTNGLEDIYVRDLQTGMTSLVTINAAGSASGNGYSTFPNITADGSTVSFRSRANDLATNDSSNTITDVFVRRLSTGITTLVSVNATGTGSGNNGSGAHTISDDGRYVAFSSFASNLVPNDTNGTRQDIFLRDLQAGTTILISANADATGSGNDESFVPLVSADGSHVVFNSAATNLVSLPDNNQTYDVFVRDVQAGTTSLVSINRQGTAASNGDSAVDNIGVMSSDGNIIGFGSNATDLVNVNDSNGQLDVFVRNIAAGTTSLASINVAGTAAGQTFSGLNGISLSADGRFVSFDSAAGDLASNDPVSSQDVFVRDLQTSITRIISRSMSGTGGNGGSLSSQLSRNGNVVIFESQASDLTPNDTDHENDVYAFSQASQIGFSSATQAVNETDGLVTLTVTRTGDISGAAAVDYTTSDGTASERRDYITALGTLRFAANETSKTITILVINDAYGEPVETFNVTLTNPIGPVLNTSSAVVSITSDEAVDGPNPVKWDSGFSSEFFVRQHYLDFLNRQPDAPGLAYWKNQIDECLTEECRNIRRVNVSGAFFLSIEFQETGFLVERIYKVAYGDADGISNVGPTHVIKVPIVRFKEFLADSQLIAKGVAVGVGNWQAQLETNKVAFTQDFVTRTRFLNAYPSTMTPAQFVDKLFVNAGITPSDAEKTSIISEFGGAGNIGDAPARARAVRLVAENAALVQAETKKAFVLMQYFGYLRRNPDDPQDSDHTGYDFWLGKLNQYGNYIDAEMVQAFLLSIEYQRRFGP